MTCIKQSIAGILPLADTECQEPKPSNIGLCQGRCAPTVWRYSGWTNVSKCSILDSHLDVLRPYQQFTQRSFSSALKFAVAEPKLVQLFVCLEAVESCKAQRVAAANYK